MQVHSKRTKWIHLQFLEIYILSISISSMSIIWIPSMSMPGISNSGSSGSSSSSGGSISSAKSSDSTPRLPFNTRVIRAEYFFGSRMGNPPDMMAMSRRIQALSFNSSETSASSSSGRDSRSLITNGWRGFSSMIPVGRLFSPGATPWAKAWARMIRSMFADCPHSELETMAGAFPRRFEMDTLCTSEPYSFLRNLVRGLNVSV
mmetsp:Transcript_1531/g.3659  ORF Transcript_1531/g.3659 Transcript_1531/m.3659 type:complete len:204 (+) Transcript_1531:81-692(+)